MEAIANQLDQIVNVYVEKLKRIPEDKLSFKPMPGKWSKKEMLGHLVDSAQNNIRRFVVAQYEDVPKIFYNQDEWVSIACYQYYSSPDLIGLWFLLNKHIVFILTKTGDSVAERKCDTGDAATHSIKWLAADYIKHMLHHLHQVLDLEPITYP